MEWPWKSGRRGNLPLHEGHWFDIIRLRYLTSFFVKEHGPQGMVTAYSSGSNYSDLYEKQLRF